MLKVLGVLCIVSFNHQFQSVTGVQNIFKILQTDDVILHTTFNSTISFIYDIVVNQHRNFDVMFHYDAADRELVEEIILHINSRSIRSINLINYDNFDRGDAKLISRPLVKKIFHVILLNDLEDFLVFVNSSKNVNVQDEALFVIPKSNTNITLLSSDSKIKIFGKVLVLTSNLNQEMTAYIICYFCEKKSRKLTKIVSFKNESTKKPSFNFGSKRFDNFHRHKFRVGFSEYFPFIWCDRSNETFPEENRTICIEARGTEIELIATVSKSLNFTTVLFFYPDYDDLMDALDMGKIDFVIGGITVTSERAEKGIFTKQYWFEGYHFLYVHKRNFRQELGRVLDPFDGNLWLLFASSIFVTSAVLYCLDRIESASSLRITCSESVWVCVYMAIEQNKKIKQVFKIRPGPAVLLVSWILVCLNVSTAYKSKLSAIVMNPPHREPSDIDELVANHYSFIINQRYPEIFVTLLVNTSDPVVQKAREKTYTGDSLCEEFIFAVENRAAILDEYPSLQYELRKNCTREFKRKHSQITDDNSNTLLRITRKSLRSIGQVWILQRQAPYKTGFDLMLGRIIEAGLLDLWRLNYTKNMTTSTIPFSHNFRNEHYHSPLSLRLLLSLFLLYGIGNGCAIVVFLIELFYYKRSAIELRSEHK